MWYVTIWTLHGNQETKTGTKSTQWGKLLWMGQKVGADQLAGCGQSGHLNWDNLLRTGSRQTLRVCPHQMWVQMLIKLQDKTASYTHLKVVKHYSETNTLQLNFKQKRIYPLAQWHLHEVRSSHPPPYPGKFSSSPAHPFCDLTSPRCQYSLRFLSPPYSIPIGRTRVGFYGNFFRSLLYGPWPVVLNQGWFSCSSGHPAISGNTDGHSIDGARGS